MAAIAPVLSIVGSLAGLAFMGGGGAQSAPVQPAPIAPAPPPPPSSKNEEAKDAAKREREAQRQAFGQEDTIATSASGLLDDEKQPSTLLGG